MKKRNMIILVVLLAIGFAGVATTLTINGLTSIGINLNDFDGKIYYSMAKAEKGGSAEITDNRKNINYISKRLTDVGEKAQLDFEVTNESTQYDANVKITCKLKDEEHLYKDYITITSPDNMLVKASTREQNKIIVTLNKLLTEDVDDLEIKCTLEATAEERENIPKEELDNSLLTYIKRQYNFGAEDLAKDTTDDENIRYIGETPNNYIEYNGETWRVIGVMNNVEASDGANEELVKIVRNSPLSATKFSDIAINAWETSLIKQNLNSGEFYNSLSEDSINLIEDVVWTTRQTTSTTLTPLDFYTQERTGNVYEGHAKTWTGKIALMYVSDWGYAVGGNGRNLGPSYGNRVLDDNHREQCLNLKIGSSENAGNNGEMVSNYFCFNLNNWIRTITNNNWTVALETGTDYGGDSAIRLIGPNYSAVSNISPWDKTQVNPTLYLKASTVLVDGDGSESNPFKIKKGKERDSLKPEPNHLEDGSLITTIKNLNSNELVVDDTNDANLRYIGGNPNNYVRYNNELWRIIGVMNNMTTAEGESRSLVKIMRATILPDAYEWYNGKRPEIIWHTSALRHNLNEGTYYNSLTDAAKNMIQTVEWNIGLQEDGDKYLAKETYEIERSNSTSGLYPHSKWTGKIALEHLSDYLYAVGGENREICLANYPSTGDNPYFNNQCFYENWISNPIEESKTYTGSEAYFQLATLNVSSYFYKTNTYATQDHHTIGTYVTGDTKPAFIITTSTASKDRIKPTLYLKPNVNIVDGEGTPDNPYILEI